MAREDNELNSPPMVAFLVTLGLLFLLLAIISSLVWVAIVWVQNLGGF